MIMLFPRDPRRLGLVLLAAGSLAFAACTGEQKAGKTTESDPPRAVRVATPTTAPAAPPVHVVGRLALRDEQQLAFRVPGIVSEVEVRAGEAVRAGQVLAQLDTTEVDAAVEEADAAMEKARRDFERGERLFADKVITQQQLDDLATALEVARSQRARARFNQKHAVIRAPAQGVVLQRMVEPNETVAGGQPALTVGGDGGGFVLEAALPGREALRVALADPAMLRIDALPDARIPATVSELGQRAHPRTGTFDLEVALQAEAPQPLASGLIARAEILPADSREATHSRIPLTAMVEGDVNGVLIFLLDEAGERVRAREVRVRWLGDDGAVLEQPLPEGARVVSVGAGFLRDGEAVRVIED